MTEQVRELAAAVTVALPVVNLATDDGVITALDLESAAIMGMTWGAWFKVGMAIALSLLIIERVVTISDKIKRGNRW